MPDQEEQKEPSYKLSASQLQKIIDYPVQKPWNEVVNIMTIIVETMRSPQNNPKQSVTKLDNTKKGKPAGTKDIKNKLTSE